MLQKQNFLFIYDAYRHYNFKELKFSSVDLLSALKGRAVILIKIFLKGII